MYLVVTVLPSGDDTYIDLRVECCRSLQAIDTYIDLRVGCCMSFRAIVTYINLQVGCCRSLRAIDTCEGNVLKEEFYMPLGEIDITS